MSLSLNINNKTEFPNESNEHVNSKSSHEDKDTSGSTINSDSKNVTTTEKNVQQKVPIIIPKLKQHSPLAMKIPISPRALKSPKRNPEEKKVAEKKEDFTDIENIKKNFAEEWSGQTTQDFISDVDNKKNENSNSSSSQGIKKLNCRLS
jgi:hypothetical protein